MLAEVTVLSFSQFLAQTVRIGFLRLLQKCGRCGHDWSTVTFSVKYLEALEDQSSERRNIKVRSAKSGTLASQYVVGKYYYIEDFHLP
jgi:hypothetical protein